MRVSQHDMASLRQAMLPLGLDDATGAVFDAARRYRYRWWRIWDADKPRCLFVMCNPSTADESRTDPTVARCIGGAKAHGYGSVEVVNIFALRATDPKELYEADDPIGPENDRHIVEAASEAITVVVAWGAQGAHMQRGSAVLRLLAEKGGLHKTCHLGLTKGGEPRHPLYVPASQWAHI